MKITLALVNGKIHTMVGNECEAVAVSEDKIVKVGTSEEITNLTDKDTRIINLEGKSVLPGFIDTHTHLVGYGASLNSVDLSTAKSIDEIIKCCQEFMKKNKVNSGEWLLGRGWNQNQFIDKKVFPTKEDLDKIGNKNPILLLRTCGHVGVANTIAMEDVGVTKDTFIEGGEFDKDINGEPNGVIREASLEWFKKNRKSKSAASEIKRAILDGGKELLKYGITSIHSEDSYDLGYSGDFLDIYNTYKQMVKDEEMPVRVYQKISLPKKQDVEAFLQGDIRTGDGDDYYKIGPMKQWCDGTMGARTAALLEPYSDDPDNKGILVYSEEELYENVMMAYKENMQVCLHSIGDGSLEMILNVYERVLKEEPRNLRHRIVHCQVGNPSLYERLSKLDVSINIQSAQTATDWTMMNSRLGNEREKHSHNWRTLTDLGVCITGSSDIPVEGPDVFYGIYAAVTRQDAESNPKGGWLPEQKVTVEEAIKMYTINAAYSAFEEDIKGTITGGKLADMIVVDKNPFEVDPKELKDIKVERVILGGRIKL